MLHTITQRLEMCIDSNIEISEVHHYTWIFIPRIFRLALEITFTKVFFLANGLQDSRGLENVLKKYKRGDAYYGPESILWQREIRIIL